MGEERSNERCDQGEKHSKPEAIGCAPCARGRIREGGADPQAEGQDDGRNDQARKQLPIAELTDFVKSPRTGGQEYDHGEGNANGFAHNEECRQH